MRGLILSCMLTFSSLLVEAAPEVHTLHSPDKQLEVRVSTGEKISYEIYRNGAMLLAPSQLAMELENQTLGLHPKLAKSSSKSATEEIQSPHYRFASFTVSYSELRLQFKENFGLIIRAYNEGVAYRFFTTMKDSLLVMNEIADMHFPEARTAYLPYTTAKPDKDPYATAFQNLYSPTKLGAAGADAGKIAFLPATVDCGSGLKMTLLEADLESYPGMWVSADEESAVLKASFAAYPSEMKTRKPRAMSFVSERQHYIAKTAGTRSFPWRIWAITEKDTEMPVNNLVYALASPNRIGDISWIKTGKVAWDWWNNWGIYGVDFKAGINMPTYKHYIDFAAENHIEFVVLDEGWYAPGSGDMLTVIPELNLQELIAYGKSKGVDIILWTVFNVLDDQLEAACKKYASMGVKGFKVDFMDRDDQTAVEMMYRIADMTAKYHLTLDLHGFYKPTGFNRTYPNIINVESVFGMEEMKWSSVEKDMMLYDVTMPYIRMMAGFLDYTPGAMRNASKDDFKPIYNNPFSQGTRCHQLAAYVIHDSPLTMLADNPTIYRKEQECTDFIVSLPNTDIEETKILSGTMGEYIVSARRVKQNWYVGGMTNWDARDISIDFSFLPQGSYQVKLFKDGINASLQAEDYAVEKFDVMPGSTKQIHLAPGGGFAMTIIKK